MSLPIIPIIKSVTDLRYQTAEIIDLLDKDPVVITRDSDTVAVMFSPKQYQQIRSILEEIEDREDAKKLEHAIHDEGEFEIFSTVDKRLRKKLKLHV